MLKTSIKVYEYHTSLNRSIKKKFHCVVNHNVDQFSILNTDQQSTHTLKKGSCYIMCLFDIPAILIKWHLRHCRLINKKTIATWCFSNYIILQSLGSSYGKHPLNLDHRVNSPKDLYQAVMLGTLSAICCELLYLLISSIRICWLDWVNLSDLHQIWQDKIARQTKTQKSPRQ